MKRVNDKVVVGAILVVLMIAMLAIWSINSRNASSVGIYGEELDVLQSEDEDVEKANDQDKDSAASMPNGSGFDATTSNQEQSLENNSSTLSEQSVEEGGSDTTEAWSDNQSGESILQPESPEEESTNQKESSESLTYDSNDGIEPGHHENELPPVVLD